MTLDHARRAKPLLRHMVGDVLRRNRLEQGRTLADVARAARVSMAYLSELERGRKEASSEVLAAICEALRIELSDLLAQVGRNLSGDRARQPSVLRPGSTGDRAAGPSRPAAPRALAGALPALAGELSGEAAGPPAGPADLPVDLVGLLGDPGRAADGPAGPPRVPTALLRSPADPRCLLAA